MLINSKTNRKANLIAVANILSTSNNILINISDLNNKTIYFGSSGLLGIKGSRRSTSYAGQSIANVLGKKLFFLGIRYLYVKIKGFGYSRYSSLKGLNLAGIKFLSILDKTPIPFNGCKPSKRRRM